MQRDCATTVCCAYIWKVHSAVVHTLFQTWHHSAVVTKVVTVCAQCSECQREEIQKSAGKCNYDSLKDSQKRKISLFWATLSGLRGKIRTPSMAHWKARGGLYIRRDWTFLRYLLRLRRYERKSVEVGVFRRGWVTFAEYLTGNGASLTNQRWCQKTRVTAISCGIKISAVHHLVLSQYMRLTDGRTELRQQCHALHYMQSHSKNETKIHAS